MRILIADDSTEIARRLQRLLLDMPYVSTVLVASTIDSAIEAVKTMQPDVLLLDHHFPEGRGVDVLAQTKIHNESSRVILFSAYASTLEVENYRQYNVHAILDKSRDLETLLDLVAEIFTESMRLSTSSQDEE